jgi:MFS family permease
MREALRWLWHRPLVRALALLTAGGDFLASGVGLIPMVIARQQMHAPPAAIGLIFTLAAVGGIVGSLASGAVQKRLSFGQAVVSTEWLFAMLFPLFLLAPNPFWLGVARLLQATTVSISNPIRLTYQLALTPDRLQGRINSLTTLLAYGSLPLGQALIGVMLQDAGARSTVLVITAGFVLIAAGATLSRHIRHAPPSSILV